MKLQNLKYFEKLIELKKYSSVAHFYNVGQPTVSMAMKRLEEDVGYDLIVKGNKYNEFGLTQKGESFHHYSKKIVDELNSLEEEIKRQSTPTKIRFGIPPMINGIYFPKIAASVHQDTLFKLESTENSSHVLIEKLKKEEIDLAIVSSISPIKMDDFKVEILAKDDFKVVVNKKSPLANREQLTFSEIDTQNIILMDDDFIQAKLFKKIQKERYSSPNLVYRTNYPDMIKKLVHDNLGVSFLLSKFVKEDDDIVMVNPPQKHSVYISLIWRANHHLNEFEKDLIKGIKAQIKN